MTGQVLILDIETRPDPAIVNSEEWWTRFKQGLDAPANYRDPLKIEAYKDEQLQKERDKMALSARTGLVVMVGVEALDTRNQTIWKAETLDRNGEADMLLEFVDELPHEVTFVGWNIEQFDLPFLLGRCLLHEVDLPRSWPATKDYRHVVDLMRLLGGGSLDHWSFLLNGKFKDVTGPALLELSMEELEAHLRDDLSLTARIAENTQGVWRK